MNTLKPGDKAPNFTAKDQDGNTISMSDYKGKKLVVFFYPAASTPTCTVEACNLSDHYGELQKAGYEILGVSADTQRKQGNFKKKFGFPYPLWIRKLLMPLVFGDPKSLWGVSLMESTVLHL